MDSSYGCRTWRPCSHHHQFQHHCPHHHHHHHHHHHFLSPHHHHHHHRRHANHHFLPNCPLHSFQFCPYTHSHLCAKFTSGPPSLQNPELTAPVSSSLILNFQVSDPSDNAAADTQMIPEGNEEGLEAEEEEEEEYLFVLTYEWKELFAKSEAKRRLAKKQANKKRRD